MFKPSFTTHFRFIVLIVFILFLFTFILIPRLGATVGEPIRILQESIIYNPDQNSIYYIIDKNYDGTYLDTLQAASEGWVSPRNHNLSIPITIILPSLSGKSSEGFHRYEDVLDAYSKYLSSFEHTPLKPVNLGEYDISIDVIHEEVTSTWNSSDVCDDDWCDEPLTKSISFRISQEEVEVDTFTIGACYGVDSEEIQLTVDSKASNDGGYSSLKGVNFTGYIIPGVDDVLVLNIRRKGSETLCFEGGYNEDSLLVFNENISLKSESIQTEIPDKEELFEEGEKNGDVSNINSINLILIIIVLSGVLLILIVLLVLLRRKNTQ